MTHQALAETATLPRILRSKRKPASRPRRLPGAVALGLLTSFWVCDLVAEPSSHPIPAPSKIRFGPEVTLLPEGRILVMGGDSLSYWVDDDSYRDSFQDVQTFDLAAGTWSAAAHFGEQGPDPVPTTQALSSFDLTNLQDGRMLKSGGYFYFPVPLFFPPPGFIRLVGVGGSTYDEWTGNGQINPDGGEWVTGYSHWMHTTTLLEDGRVLVVGGQRWPTEEETETEDIPSHEAHITGAHCEIFDPATNTWSQVAPLHVPRRLHTATRLPDGRVLVTGGNSGPVALGLEPDAPFASTEIYDPATDTWTLSGNMHRARHSHTANLLGDGRVLVTGGNLQDSAETFDPATGQWVETTQGELPPPESRFFRAEHFVTRSVTLPDGRVLRIPDWSLFDPDTGSWISLDDLRHVPEFRVSDYNGVWGSEADGEAQAYRTRAEAEIVLPDGAIAEIGVDGCRIVDLDLGRWTAIGDLPANHTGHTATLLAGGHVLVAGGSGTNTAVLYRPGNGGWQATGSMTEARDGATATLLNDGRVLLAGGQNGTGKVPSGEVYDSGTGSWLAGGNMQEGRTMHSASLLRDGRVLVAGGRGAGEFPLASMELYDPDANGWTALHDMTQARSGHASIVLPDGSVLVTGGTAGSVPVASCEIVDLFDATSTGGMLEARSGHSISLLPDGRVLVAGGTGVNGLLASTEIFDPGTGSWTAGEPLSEARTGHRANTVVRGRILITGGQGSSGRLAAVEKYDPLTGQWTLTDPLPSGLESHTATFLATGEVLVAGGIQADGLRNQAKLYVPFPGMEEDWRPLIDPAPTALPAVELGSPFVIGGQQLDGVFSADGRRGAAESNAPIITLQRIDNGQISFLPLDPGEGWSSTSWGTLGARDLVEGPALMTVFSNGVPSVSSMVNVEPDPNVWDYVAVTGGLQITAYLGGSTNPVVPDEIDGLPVLQIGGGCFDGNTRIKAVQLPEGLQQILSAAFRGCVGLRGIVLPDSLTDVSANAFEGCWRLERAVIGNGVTSIPISMFAGCSALRDVQIGTGVTRIRPSAFLNCGSLTGIEIPQAVREISPTAFVGCGSLVSFDVSPANLWFQSLDGLLYNKAGTILLRYPPGRPDAHFDIPEGVVELGESSFALMDQLTSITLPSTLRVIGFGAFQVCTGLEKVVIPDGVTTIGPGAFYQCTSLELVVVGRGVTSVGAQAFNYCSVLRGVYFEGDAPPSDSSILPTENQVPVYRRPAANGWPAVWSGVEVQTWDATFLGTPYAWLESFSISGAPLDEADLLDPDGDHKATWEEFLAGTDPMDALSFFSASILREGNGTITLRWPSAAQREYRILRSDGLGSPWVHVAGVRATPPFNTWIVDRLIEETQFYRVEAYLEENLATVRVDLADSPVVAGRPLEGHWETGGTMVAGANFGIEPGTDFLLGAEDQIVLPSAAAPGPSGTRWFAVADFNTRLRDDPADPDIKRSVVWGGAVSLTCNGLDPGRRYVIQIAHSTPTYRFAGRFENNEFTFGSGLSVPVQPFVLFDGADANVPGDARTEQVLITVAISGESTFTYHARDSLNASAIPALTAFQVRELPEGR